MRTRLRWELLLPVVGWAWLLAVTMAGLSGADVRRHHFEAAGLCFGGGLLVFVVLRWRVAAPVPARDCADETWTAYLIPMAAAIAAYGWSIDLGPLSDDFVLHRWASSGTLLPT